MSTKPSTSEPSHHAEWMASQTREAHRLGISLEEQLQRRADSIGDERTLSQRLLEDASISTGPLLDGSQPWHADYVSLCRQNLVRILRRELTAQDAAVSLIRANFPLSHSALRRWAKIADLPPDTLSSLFPPRHRGPGAIPSRLMAEITTEINASTGGPLPIPPLLP